jgi:membrane protein
VQTVLFTAIFMVLPNKRNTMADSLPGAVLSSLGWLMFSKLYSIYVEHFAGLSNIFGSVYAVALSLLWLYFCMSILFYGGTLNAWLIARKRRKAQEE